MITKGDMLTFLGKASGPLGSFKFGPSPIQEASTDSTKKGNAPASLPNVGSSCLNSLFCFTEIFFHRCLLTDPLSAVSSSPRCFKRHRRPRIPLLLVSKICSASSSEMVLTQVLQALKMQTSNPLFRIIYPLIINHQYQSFRHLHPTSSMVYTKKS